MTQSEKSACRVLCIDDEEAIRASIRRYLSEYDYEVLEAENGEKGLELFAKERPHLVLTDLRMSGVDGLEVVATVVKSAPGTPVLIVSGTGKIRDVIEALRLGAWNYLLKPIEDLSILRHAVEQSLERARLLEDNRRHQEHLEELVLEKTRELQEMERHLTQAERLEAIGVLAGGIAHDFNNILNVLLGYLYLARTKAHNDAEQAEFLQEVQHGIMRAVDLVAQIRTFSLQTQHEARPIQVNHLVKESLKFLRASIPATVEIRHQINSNAIIMVDPTEFNRIIMNLCINATLAMEHGGKLEVRLEDVLADKALAAKYPHLASGRLLCLTVSDTGCGMPPEVMTKIFEKFFTTRRDKGGTGLGLAVVHDIVATRGGAVEVMSEPGRGTTFHIYLPTMEKAAEGPVEAEEQPLTGTEKLLVVDDDPSSAELLQRLLASLGYRVTVFRDSREARDAFTRAPRSFDLVVTDISMPHLNGEDLVRELRRLRPDTPVILHTGDKGCLFRESIMDLGANEILIKPVTVASISQAIRRALAPTAPAKR